MSNNTVFTWKILNMEAIMSYSSLTNVVRTVYWQIEGKDDDNKYGTHFGHQQLDVDNIDPASFTSYSSLSSAQVVQWVKDALNGDTPNIVSQLEADIQTQMDSEEIGSRLTGLPWS